MKATDKKNNELLEAIDRGIAESQHRNSGEFDGLLGDLPEGSSVVLRDVTWYLRDHLLQKYSEKDTRALLRQYRPRAGYHNRTPVSEDVQLALDLLNSIASALDVSGPRLFELLAGKDGKRGRKVLEGARHAAEGRHGDLKTREARYKEYQRAVDQAQRANTHRSHWDICQQVADRFGVSARTIQRRTSLK